MNCVECGSNYVERHHIFFGQPNRKLSEKYGCIEYLCSAHHRDLAVGVHGLNKKLDLKLKQKHQKRLEEEMTREQFIKIFGRSWL